MDEVCRSNTNLISLSSIRQFQSQYIRIGKSSEGKDLFLLKVGMPSPRGITKPAVWIDGGVHARYRGTHHDICKQ